MPESGESGEHPAPFPHEKKTGEGSGCLFRRRLGSENGEREGKERITRGRFRNRGKKMSFKGNSFKF